MTNKTTEKDPLTRVERRQRKTREKLIQTVRKLTAESGVDALTVRDIAEGADIALGSFYNHFDSKETLLHEAAADIAFQSGEIIDHANATSADALEVIATAFTLFDHMNQQDPILGWFAVRVSAHNPSWAATLFERLERDIQNGIASDKFNVPSVRLAVANVGASMMSFYRSRLLGESSDADVIAQNQLMLRLLGADDHEAKDAAERVWNKIHPQSEEN